MSTTPVWQVDGWTLHESLAKIEQQWSVLAEILDDAALFDLRDSDVSGWSCGEHAGHLAIVTRWIAHGIEKNLEDPERNAASGWTASTESILEAGDFPRGAARAPAQVDPAGRPRQDFLPVLPAAIDAWLAIREKQDRLPDCPARFQHFILGYLTSEDWVRFCAIHTAHHLAVVRDIRKARSVASPTTGGEAA